MQPIEASQQHFSRKTRDQRWKVWLQEKELVAHVADALTKLDNRAHDLLRKFLQSKVWRNVWDPDFTSSKKLKQQEHELRDECMTLRSRTS